MTALLILIWTAMAVGAVESVSPDKPLESPTLKRLRLARESLDKSIDSADSLSLVDDPTDQVSAASVRAQFEQGQLDTAGQLEGLSAASRFLRSAINDAQVQDTRIKELLAEARAGRAPATGAEGATERNQDLESIMDSVQTLVAALQDASALSAQDSSSETQLQSALQRLEAKIRQAERSVVAAEAGSIPGASLFVDPAATASWILEEVQQRYASGALFAPLVRSFDEIAAYFQSIVGSVRSVSSGASEWASSQQADVEIAASGRRVRFAEDAPVDEQSYEMGGDDTEEWQPGQEGSEVPPGDENWTYEEDKSTGVVGYSDEQGAEEEKLPYPAESDDQEPSGQPADESSPVGSADMGTEVAEPDSAPGGEASVGEAGTVATEEQGSGESPALDSVETPSMEVGDGDAAAPTGFDPAAMNAESSAADATTSAVTEGEGVPASAA